MQYLFLLKIYKVSVNEKEKDCFIFKYKVEETSTFKTDSLNNNKVDYNKESQEIFIFISWKESGINQLATSFRLL